jgi:hypothetical protein
VALPENYQSLTATEKQALLWRNIEATAYRDGALPQYASLSFYLHAVTNGLMSVDYLRQTFLVASDELPSGRTKIIHTYGTVACVELVPRPGHPFTGVLCTGARGVARLSLAFPGDVFCPGIGLKLLIDGRPSVNIVAMPSLLGQGRDENVFARAYVNPAPTETTGIAEAVLKHTFTETATSFHAEVMRWNHMPLDDWASQESNGTQVAEPCVPWGITLEPVPGAQTSSTPGPDYRVKLRAIAPGTVIFKVMMRTEADAPPLHVADLVTRSPFVASRWGDEGLYFQHAIGRVDEGAVAAASAPAAAPCLPQYDQQPGERTRRLTEARSEYRWKYDSLPEVAMSETVPSAGHPSLEWLALVAGKLVDISVNTARIDDDEERSDRHHKSHSILGDTIMAARAGGARSALEAAIQLAMEGETEGRPESLADFTALFQEIALPQIAATWWEDATFAAMRVAGPNPMMLARVPAPPENFPVTEADYSAAMGPGDSLVAAGREGRLYLADYAATTDSRAARSPRARNTSRRRSRSSPCLPRERGRAPFARSRSSARRLPARMRRSSGRATVTRGSWRRSAFRSPTGTSTRRSCTSRGPTS